MIETRRYLFGVLIFVMTGCQSILNLADEKDCPDPNWPFCEFQHRVDVTFLNADGERDLEDIPIAVKLTPENFNYDGVLADGRDILFATGDHQELHHEIEDWNPGGDSWLWVRVPSIDRLSDDSFIHMYYGYGNARGTENELNEVWPPQYELVHHFAGELADGVFRDSSGNGRDARVFGGVLPTRDTLAGPGAEFDGATGTYLDIGVPEAMESLPGSVLTFETWFQSNDVAVQTHIFHKEGGCRGWRLYSQNGILQGRAGNADEGCGDAQDIISDNPIVQGEWYHATLTVDRRQPGLLRVCTELRQLIASELVRNRDCDDISGLRNEARSDAPMYIGANYDHVQNFNGRLDELRVATGETDPAQIDAQFLSVLGQFVSIGDEQAQ